MKKRSLIAMTMLLVLLTGCGSSGSASVTLETNAPAAEAGNAGIDTSGTELKLSMPVPNTGAWGAAAEVFSKEINEKTNGKYYVTIFPNDELSGGNQVGGIEMLQSGATDLHMHDVLIWAAIDARLAVPAYPWLMPTTDVADEILDGEGGEAMRKILAESDAICLGIGTNGYRQLVNTKKAITKPSDLQGLKIRVPGNPAYISLYKALGADPVTMSASERYTALQQGAIDGCENPLELHVTQKDAEVVKYCTVWNYSYDPVYLNASTQLWDKLTDEEKVIFKDAGEHACQVMRDTMRRDEAGYREQMEKQFGIEFADLTEEQIAEFKALATVVYDEFKDTIGEDVFNSFGYSFN